MLGILNARPKPWIVTELSFTHSSPYNRLSADQLSLLQVWEAAFCSRRNHSTTCRIHSSRSSSNRGGAASIWHAIYPSSAKECQKKKNSLVPRFYHEQKGEGSWNVPWDVRPARWLHSSDSAWLLFGVCACLENIELVHDKAGLEEKDRVLPDYKVIGVPADGRCLFRAVSFGACLKSAEELPDENRQRELADDLRAQVVEELLKRRKEIEWMIEGDFDLYVKSIQRPNAWGGEPELLMASHVLRVPISVFMIDRRSGDLVNIGSYGHEYGKEASPIQVAFHGYGHYDVLEIFSEKAFQRKGDIGAI